MRKGQKNSKILQGRAHAKGIQVRVLNLDRVSMDPTPFMKYSMLMEGRGDLRKARQYLLSSMITPPSLDLTCNFIAALAEMASSRQAQLINVEHWPAKVRSP